ncbi:hypothetical protein ACGFMM_09760 [Streptomyces sp. NPDC048604]|uniref:hypothetical protein n=1 Tax=Streptomyces sp. NPDC048604 TaxID=3365578 RepID=UPI00371FA9D5
MRKFISTLACLSAVAAGSLAFAQPASAGGYGCSGSEIGKYGVGLPISSPSPNHVGDIRVYYDASTGMNCAVAVKNANSGYGEATYVQIGIDRCVAGTRPGTRCTVDGTDDYDNGWFKYYAGPVSINAAGRCIVIYAEIFNTKGESGYRNTYAVHCG